MCVCMYVCTDAYTCPSVGQVQAAEFPEDVYVVLSRVYVSIDANMHVYVYNVHVFVQENGKRIFSCVHVCVLCIRACMCVLTSLEIVSSSAYICMCVCVCIYIYIYIYVCICICICIMCMHMRAFTCVHQLYTLEKKKMGIKNKNACSKNLGMGVEMISVGL